MLVSDILEQVRNCRLAMRSDTWQQFSNTSHNVCKLMLPVHLVLFINLGHSDVFNSISTSVCIFQNLPSVHDNTHENQPWMSSVCCQPQEEVEVLWTTLAE